MPLLLLFVQSHVVPGPFLLGAWTVWVLFFAVLVINGMDQNPIAVSLQDSSSAL